MLPCQAMSNFKDILGSLVAVCASLTPQPLAPPDAPVMVDGLVIVGVCELCFARGDEEVHCIAASHANDYMIIIIDNPNVINDNYVSCDSSAQHVQQCYSATTSHAISV